MSILSICAIVTGLLLASMFLLSKNIEVKRTQIINGTVEGILKLATSNEGYQVFNPYIETDPNLKIELFGPKEGIGSGFKFKGKDGQGSQTISAVTSKSVVYDIDMGAFGKSKQILELNQKDSGVEISWKLKADFGYNPIFRLFGLFMDRMVGPHFEKGLANLNNHFSK